MDVTTIAQKLDFSICTVFLKIPCNSWISWALGYRDDDISNFYDAVLSFRGRCAQYLQKFDQQIHKWKLLAEVSPPWCKSNMLLTSIIGIAISTPFRVLDDLYLHYLYLLPTDQPPRRP
jgi:hypothetical protein